MEETAIRGLVDINRHFVDKVTPAGSHFYRFNMSFKTERLTPVELLQAIRRGHAWTAPHKKIRRHRPTRQNPNYHTSYRVKENVQGVQFLGLDSDTEDARSRIDSWLNEPFIANNAAFLHTSSSHTEAAPRSRIVFAVDRLLTIEEAELAIAALLERYPWCDQSARDASRVFYGARDCEFEMLNNLLPYALVESELIAPIRARRAAKKAARDAERAARQALRDQFGGQVDDSRILRYMATTIDNILDDIQTSQPGSGERHRLMRDGAVRLGSLGAASWLTPAAFALLEGIADELLFAAAANGYVADYGEQDALRTIEQGVAYGEKRPAEEPLWNQPDQALDIGTTVNVWINGMLKATGEVVARQESDAGLFFKIDSRPRTWFAAAHLRRK